MTDTGHPLGRFVRYVLSEPAIGQRTTDIPAFSGECHVLSGPGKHKAEVERKSSNLIRIRELRFHVAI